MENKYLVFSYLGKRSFAFKNERDAVLFFSDFIGDAMLMENNLMVEQKHMIVSFADLVHAGIFIQHGITRDGTNIILEQHKEKPSADTVRSYEEAKDMITEPGKGLALFGHSGVGKTTMMRLFSMASSSGYIDCKPFEKVSVKTIISTFKSHGYDVLEILGLSENCGKNVCIDDLGRDKGMRMQYGDKINIVGDIIESRYDSYLDKGLITHFTSNYSEKELRGMYDEKEPVIWGRICEMTNFKVVNGVNYRMPNTQQ